MGIILMKYVGWRESKKRCIILSNIMDKNKKICNKYTMKVEKYLFFAKM